MGPESCKTCHNNAGAAKKATSHGGHVVAASFTVKPHAGGTYDEWHNTTHAAKGVSCENCHGPGSKHVASPAATNILTFPNLTSPVVCGQCHGPLADQWATSAHATLIPDPVQETADNPAAFQGARCVACHSGLARTSMEEGTDLSTIPTTDLANIANQTIKNVPHVASCSTCHDPHAKTGNLSAVGEEKQIRHPLSSLDTSAIAPGTTPGSFTAFNHQCAECHNGRGADGRDAKLQSSTARPNMHASNQFNMLLGVGGSEGSGPVVRNTDHANAVGQCAHCHMPGESHAFKTNYDTSCQPCHSTADASGRAVALKTEVSNGLYALQARMETWAQKTLGNPILWEYTSNIPTGTTAPDQSLIPIEIKRARHNYYFLVRDSSMGIHNANYARLLLQVANQNLDAIGAAKAPAAIRQIPANVKLDAIFKAMRTSGRSMKGALD